MRILIINPPHESIGSRIPDDHLPPLGLLSIAGPLLDDGHTVELLDAEFGPMKQEDILWKTMAYKPDVVMLGHSGSTSAQPIISELTELIKVAIPQVIIIIGGVYPTYHWKQILEDDPQINYIVCGEGEEVTKQLIHALSEQKPVEEVAGIAYRKNKAPVRTKSAKVIQNLDEYRVAWELMEPYHYSYWGGKKAVVVQFSRGCPYPCNYCGQSLFWKKWRHRNPQKFAKELAMLHHKYGIEIVNFADENPTTNPKVWKEFLLALIAENVPLRLVGSTRADNIVRDADFLHLYKKAGFERFLLGIENYDEVVLEHIKKAGSTTTDRAAIRLLRKHDILSMATFVVGFSDETLKDYYRTLKQILAYDPDQIQALYVTPHKWTPFYHLVKDKKLVQLDQRKWDYKHQVLETKYLRPWQVILLLKLMEVILQVRPRAIKRVLFHRDKLLRDAMRWYYKMGRRVWFHEVFAFIFKDKTQRSKVRLREYWQ